MQAIADTVTYLQTVDSTNNYAMARIHEGLAMHGDAIVAYEQTAGKGQRGKKWLAKPGENLLLSVIVEPNRLITQQFSLSAAVALSCRRLIQSYFNDNIFIKWPNDIYWNDRKAGGVLIENTIQNDKWLYAVIGIGLNINQVVFDIDGIPPVSLKQLTGKEFSIEKIARELCVILEAEITVSLNDEQELLSRYNEALYKKDQTVSIRHSNIILDTVVKGVNKWGDLITFSGMEKTYSVGEIEWLPGVKS